jgi:hypothetical protein
MSEFYGVQEGTRRERLDNDQGNQSLPEVWCENSF